VSLLRRGFKTWCENAAANYRRDLSLSPYAPLDPRLLARKLDIMVWTTAEVPNLDLAVLKHLTRVDSQSWSAVTLRCPDADLVIVNETHVHGRQNNTLMHELSHIILAHPPAQCFVSADGMMMLADYNKMHEEEANCLAGTLLVPRVALLWALDRGFDNQRAAGYFGVTIDMLQMRRNLTGVDLQRSRRRSRAG
jgi:Zn-dependent peptidase ImmA (M78 family)